MAVYALIWIKLPTALSVLAKNSPSSSRLWLHSNYSADWNEPVWGRETHEHAPTLLAFRPVPLGPRNCLGCSQPRADTTDFSPRCVKLLVNLCICFRNRHLRQANSTHRAQVPAGELDTLNISNKFLLFSSIVGTLPRNLHFSACVPSLDLPKFPHGKI